jgi:hypothetical protein
LTTIAPSRIFSFTWPYHYNALLKLLLILPELAATHIRHNIQR